jgi:two-component system NtrC family sensor kinase
MELKTGAPMYIATILLVGIDSPALIGQLKLHRYNLIEIETIDGILAIESAFELMIIGQRLVGGFGSADVERLFFLNNSVPIAVLIENPDAIDNNLLTLLQRGTLECLYQYEIDKGLVGQRIDKLFITTQFEKNLQSAQQNSTEKESLKKELDFRDTVLRNLQEINANIIGSITSGLMILDPRGTIMLANRHMHTILNVPEQSLIGIAYTTVLPEEIKTVADHFLSHDANADPTPKIEKCRIKDRFLNIAFYWIINDVKKPIGIMIMASDITELENTSIQLYRAEKLATMGTMLSGIAHELRNPLSIISARAQRGLAKNTYEDLWVHKNFESIDVQAQRCATIVNSLLDFTRHTASKTGYHRLAEILEETLTYVAYQNSFTDIAICKEFEPDLLAFGDRSRYIQVFVNIITNAAHAMAGKGSLTIRTLRDSPQFSRIDITDSGPGIDASVSAKIFDPFFTTKDPGKGTGLGLSIVHKIAQESGGRVWFSSKPGATTFSVALPSIKE